MPPMSKCHVRELRNVVAALLCDATAAFPTLEVEFRKDLARLEDLIPHRGIHLFLVDMPAVCKHFDKALAEKSYKLSGLPLTKRYSNRVVIPKFLRGLYLRVFDEVGNLRESPCIESIFFIRQILLVGKKADIACTQEKVILETDNFLDLDLSLPKPEIAWELIGPTEDDFGVYTGFASSLLYQGRLREHPHSGELSRFLTVLDTVSSIVTSTLGPYRFQEWKFRNGPGAIAEVTRKTNKYCWRNWSLRLECVFPVADCGFHSYAAWAGRCQPRDISLHADCMDRGEISSKEPISRLVAVPKDFTKPRLIAVEPSEHMWCQQNVKHYMYTRAEQSWISKFVRFHDQTLNQELCRKGSEDGSLITLDLSSASDRVTCHAVGQFFRGNLPLLAALQACRTRYLEQEVSPRREKLVSLRKFSTMGNACTFPVESLLFLSIVLSASLVSRRLKPTLENIRSLAGQVAVFGDDIVAPNSCRELLVEALEVLDFKVNTKKSHWSGNFRESCGIDSYAGVCVTPAYWRSPIGSAPESIASFIEVRNNFHKKWLLHSSQYLASTIRDVVIPHVSMDSGVLGLKSFSTPPSTSRVRWNADLQREEALVTLFSSKVKRIPIEDDSAILQFFTEDPPPFSQWKGGWSQRSKVIYNLGWAPVADLGCKPIRDGVRGVDPPSNAL